MKLKAPFLLTLAWTLASLLELYLGKGGSASVGQGAGELITGILLLQNVARQNNDSDCGAFVLQVSRH